jgi:membrane associated rhomboid family serine protease
LRFARLAENSARLYLTRVNQPREPIFNVPITVVVLLAVLVLLHVIRVYVLSPEAASLFVWNFAFVPGRYGLTGVLASGWEYGWAFWTFVTYAFIHADFMHLGFNAVWLLAFGSAVARRFGAGRFLLFYALTAVAGALAHLVTHLGELQPMIGASASISGTMGAASRFAFQRGGPLDRWGGDGDEAYRMPAPPLLVALRDTRVLAFVGAWFALNLFFGLGAWSIVGEDQTIAWEAHVGGFLAGLLLFKFFDPVRPRSDNNVEGDRTLH